MTLPHLSIGCSPSPADGSLKLYVTRCALRFRREHRALFAQGSYVPLRAAGEKNKHVIAFARSFRGDHRRCAGRTILCPTWGVMRQCRWVQRPGETRKSSCASSFPPARIATCSPGKTVSSVRRDGDLALPVAEAFAHLPIAMLVNVQSKSRGTQRMSDRFDRTRTWELRFGASVRSDDSVEFRVWAPNLTNLAVRVMGENAGEHPRTIPMKQSSDSEFAATVPQRREGTDYFYVLDGERERPDPVSRWQPARRARSFSRRRSHVVSLVRPGLVWNPAARFHHLRTPHRHVHPRRDL